MPNNGTHRTEQTLGELGEFRNGANFSQDDYGPGYPIVNVKQLYRGRYASMDDVHELSASAVSNPESLFLRYGDILFARSSVKASGAGQVAMVGPCRPNAVFSGFIIRFRVTAIERVTPEYLNYLLRSPVYRELLTRIGSGTTITNLSQDTLASLPIPLPPLVEQKAIVAVLGAMDDKIELNRRMNATLEAMTQSFFKSRFVDAIQVNRPNTWRQSTLGEVAENPRRGVQPNAIQPSTPYIALEHMPRRCIALSEWDHADKLESNKFEFRRGEILFGKLRPYFHKVGVAPLDGVCSTDILVIRPKNDDWFGFVLGHVSSVELVNHTDASSTGTKMPRTNWNDIAHFDVALPPKELAADFNARILPLVKRIISNIHESRTLAAVRDTLLPKLLSGEIRTPEASV